MRGTLYVASDRYASVIKGSGRGSFFKPLNTKQEEAGKILQDFFSLNKTVALSRLVFFLGFTHGLKPYEDQLG